MRRQHGSRDLTLVTQLVALGGAFLTRVLQHRRITKALVSAAVVAALVTHVSKGSHVLSLGHTDAEAAIAGTQREERAFSIQAEVSV